MPVLPPLPSLPSPSLTILMNSNRIRTVPEQTRRE